MPIEDVLKELPGSYTVMRTGDRRVIVFMPSDDVFLRTLEDEAERMVMAFGPLPRWDITAMKKPNNVNEGQWKKYLRYPENFRKHKETISKLKAEGFTDATKLLDEWQRMICNSSNMGGLERLEYINALKASLKHYGKELCAEEENIYLMLAATQRYWAGLARRVAQLEPGEQLF